MRNRSLAILALAAAAAAAAHADVWTVHMTVDNQFDAYFGTSAATTMLLGSGNNWPTTYTFSGTSAAGDDSIYVATSSDQRVAQGFLGQFINQTGGFDIQTGLPEWQVFAAGAWAATNPYYPNPWPASLQPTQAQVDAAIAYANSNNLWENTDTAPGGALNGVAPWGTRPGIPSTAEWIWHRADNGPLNPLGPGFNHDEFLIFRVQVVPAPSAAALLGLGSAAFLRRRRA